MRSKANTQQPGPAGLPRAATPEDGMLERIATRRFVHAGATYAPGDRVRLGRAEAERLGDWIEDTRSGDAAPGKEDGDGAQQ